MIIVINTHSLIKDDDAANFVAESFIHLAQQHPKHQFIFLAESKNNFNYILNSNCSVTEIGKAPVNTLLWKYWYNYKIPGVLKRLKANAYISLNGIYCLRTTVPQYMLLQHVSLSDGNSIFSKKITQYYKNNASEYLCKAKKIWITSAAVKHKLATMYSMDEVNIGLLPLAINQNFIPLSWEDQIAIKSNTTNGKDYFLVKSDSLLVENFILLLKAFSKFKRWQKSSLQLIIISIQNKNIHLLKQQLTSYKYKEDVQLLTDITAQDYAKLLAASYAFIYPYFQSNLPIAILQALQCKIPVVTQNINNINLTFADSVEYVNANKIDDIAAKMILLYKDENSRNNLIEKGKTIAANYHWNNTCSTLWEAISISPDAI